MARKITDIIFAYSEQMINEQNAVLKSIGKKFVPGEVFIGNSSKKYTKLVTNDEFNELKLRYTDIRIVARGDRYKTHYTPPSTIMSIKN